MIDEISSFFFRNKLKNKDFTLITRDCVGGVLYHQLQMKFLSPTINLFLTPEDFNYFCLYLHEYIEGEMKEFVDKDYDYPIGLLTPKKNGNIDRPIKIHFMHYPSFIEASKKWDERKNRINWDNLYVISSFCYPGETDGFNEELVAKWNQIKYKKVVLVDKKYGFDDEYVIKKPEQCKDYAWLLYSPSKRVKWKRTFNEFNFIKFLNK